MPSVLQRLTRWKQWQGQYDFLYQTVYNGASELFLRRAEGDTGGQVNQDEFYIGVNVPTGRRLFVFDRRLKLTEGTFRIDLITTENNFTGGVEGGVSSMNLAGSHPVVQSRALSDVTPDGIETIVSRDFVDAGNSPGVSRPPGSAQPDATMRIFEAPFMWRIQRIAGGGAYSLALNLLVWEESV